jgi:tetratricopeptide (TPR) repeat protein
VRFPAYVQGVVGNVVSLSDVLPTGVSMPVGLRRMRLAGVSADTPKAYEVDPLAYVAARLRSADPPYVTNEIVTLALPASDFLDDGDLPEQWRRNFLRTVTDLCRASSGRPRINAIGLLLSLTSKSPLVREAFDGLVADGTWDLCRVAYEEHVRALPAPPEDTMEHIGWTVTRTMPSVYLPPSMSGEPMFTLLGPEESAARDRARALSRDAGTAQERGAYREAAELWAEATRLWPDDREARFNRAVCLLRLDEAGPAVPLLDALCEERPGEPAYQAMRGAALLRLDRPDEALTALDRALELDPGRPSALLNKARLLSGRGQDPAAEELLRAGVRADGWQVPPDQLDDTVTALGGYAMGALAGHRFDVAADLTAVLCGLAPENGDWWLARALAAEAQGRRGETQEYLAGADRGRLTGPALVMRADLALRTGDAHTAMACADFALTTEPDATGALWIRAKAAVDTNDPEGAVPYYERYLALQPDDGRTWNDLGVCYQHIRDGERALACFRSAVRWGPGDALHWANLAMAALNVAADGTDATEIWDHILRARALAPDDPTTQLAVAAFHLSTGNFAAAERTAAELVRRTPGLGQARAILAACQETRAARSDDGGDVPGSGG